MRREEDELLTKNNIYFYCVRKRRKVKRLVQS